MITIVDCPEYNNKFIRLLTDTPQEDYFLNQILTYKDNNITETVLFWDRDGCYTFRGYREYIKYKAKSFGIKVKDETKDELNLNVRVDPNILPGKTLYDFQVVAVRKALMKKYGAIVSPVGSGKTVMAMALMKHHSLPTVVVVPSTYLEDQFYLELRNHGFEDVERANSIRDRVPKYIVGTWKSVLNLINNRNIAKHYKCLICDEYHHQQSKTWRQIFMNMYHVEYMIGFTGTLYRSVSIDYDNLSLQDFLTLGVSNGVICEIPYKILIEDGILAEPHIYLDKIGSPRIFSNYRHTVKSRGITNNSYRNKRIAWHIKSFAKLGMLVMGLTDSIKHAHKVADCLDSELKQYTYIYTGNRIAYTWNGYEWEKFYSDFGQLLDLIDRGLVKVLLATTVFNEGINLPQVDALVMMYTGKAYTRTMQQIGRVLRTRPNKKKAFIIDFYDVTHSYLKSQANKRLEIYQRSGFNIHSMYHTFLHEVNEELECRKKKL